MAYCEKCGAQLEESAKFCEKCGASTGAAQGSIAGDINNFVDTPDTTADYSAEDIEKNKVYAILAYFGILVLIPILAAPNSRFARFHANQGLILFIAAIIFSFVPFVGWIFNLITLVFAIMGIVYAAQGKAKELPLIGSIKIIK